MSKPNVELLHSVFDMPTRLIASITLECNDAMTIYVHYIHPFQHIHLNYKNFKRSFGLAEIVWNCFIDSDFLARLIAYLQFILECNHAVNIDCVHPFQHVHLNDTISDDKLCGTYVEFI